MSTYYSYNDKYCFPKEIKSFALIRQYIFLACCLMEILAYSSAKSNNSLRNRILNNSAFCIENTAFSRYYPLDAPEDQIPWIWDAVFDSLQNIVELTTMNRIPCKFNKLMWKRLVQLYPQYRNQLAFGRDSDILVNFDDTADKEQLNFLHGTIVLCEYFLSNKLVFQVKSLKIRGKLAFTEIGTLQIRCPSPNKDISWDGIRLKLNPKRRYYQNTVYSDTTMTVPVCELPHYDYKEKKYGLSLCSATNRANRKQLVEWIEYYLLMGVEHVFIYDTSIEPHVSNLKIVLSDYIEEGIVSVIEWHYMNCVRGMASGRSIVFIENSTTHHFAAPKPISQNAALASCYVRFKHTSKYIIHVDDDEFMVFSSNAMKSYIGSNNTIETLLDFADAAFSKHPDSGALVFLPIMYYPCNATIGIEHLVNNSINYSYIKNRNEQSYQDTPLPRLGVWSNWVPFFEYERKLLLRTETIGMFYVHYVSLYEFGPWRTRDSTSDLILPLDVGVILHYKFPYQLSKRVFGAVMPITKDSYIGDCRNAEMVRFSNYSHPQIPFHIGIQLKQNYLKRMKVN